MATPKPPTVFGFTEKELGTPEFLFRKNVEKFYREESQLLNNMEKPDGNT